jgi:hypothetical protein
MALTLTPVTPGRRRTPLEAIDPEVSETIEEAYEFCKGDEQRLETPDFPTRADAENWLSDARAYAYQRGTIEGLSRVVINGNVATGSVKDAYVARFRVEDYDGGDTGQ